ncbi:hypothetical protein TNIN_484441 [Trichonephila inaurata madagascariensis]|uniref:Uncharacterized protein n=1 Tax=Trichonephila inaurata madagascariensis TaxID=2747483 RepID=A0A8X6XRH7_9ARAC|nr:hypothetical protein TNIN_484441 [Trichonephila inaurata madagascariensis]
MLKSETAAKNKLTPPKEMTDKTETAKDTTEDNSVLKKNTRTKDFISPQNLQRSKSGRIPLFPHPLRRNQYQALFGKHPRSRTRDIAVVPVAKTSKITPINLKIPNELKNQLSKKYRTLLPSTKLSGEFLKIFCDLAR